MGILIKGISIELRCFVSTDVPPAVFDVKFYAIIERLLPNVVDLPDL